MRLLERRDRRHDRLTLQRERPMRVDERLKRFYAILRICRSLLNGAKDKEETMESCPRNVSLYLTDCAEIVTFQFCLEQHLFD